MGMGFDWLKRVGSDEFGAKDGTSNMDRTNTCNAHSPVKVSGYSRSKAMAEFKTDGSLLNANTEFLRLMGYQLNEVKGKPHSLFVDADTRHSIDYRRLWDALQRGELVVDEFKNINRQRENLVLRSTYMPVINLNEEVVKIIGLFEDVSESEKQLQNFHGQVQAIDKSQAVIEFKMDGTILWANQNFLNTVGYELNEVVGKHHSIFVDEQFKASEEYKDFWKKLNEGKFESKEYKRFGKGHKEIWIQASYNPIFDEDGRPYKVVKYAVDVTQQKKEYAESRGKLEAISRSQAVIEFDPMGNILTANENFLSAVGYSLREIQGQHHSMFVDPKYGNSNEYRQFWQKLGRGEFIAAEFKRFGKNNKEIWIQASYNPIFDQNGAVSKVVKFATDVTEQKLQNADFSGQVEAIGKSQAVIEFNMDSTIITANENFLKTTGYALNEIQGEKTFYVCSF